jgi:hypothetical protein
MEMYSHYGETYLSSFNRINDGRTFKRHVIAASSDQPGDPWTAAKFSAIGLYCQQAMLQCLYLFGRPRSLLYQSIVILHPGFVNPAATNRQQEGQQADGQQFMQHLNSSDASTNSDRAIDRFAPD